MKAGLATKMVLHTLTTGAMVRLGKVYGNLMVDLRPTSRKLRARGLRIIATLTGLPPAPARALARRAGWRPAVALLMHRRGLEPDAARRRLAAHGGNLRAALGDGRRELPSRTGRARPRRVEGRRIDAPRAAR
jgi:N-acetylmuramic acid 6-phosphate etherase